MEKRFTDEIMGFSGQPDLGLRMKDGRNKIVDIKTPVQENPTWKSQVATYLNLANQKYKVEEKDGDQRIKSGAFTDCLALQLKQNGNEAVAFEYLYKDEDYFAFLSALNAHRYFDKEE